MPYIKQLARTEFALDYGRWAKNPGELNYNFTMALGMYGPSDSAEIIIKEFIKRYLILKGESYQTFNDIIGALTCCFKEIKRRIELKNRFEIVDFLAKIVDDFYNNVVAPYEDQKIVENGDLEVFKTI